MSRDDQKLGLSFTHQMMMQEALEAGRTRADALALIEELLNRGLVDQRDLAERRERLDAQLVADVDPATRVQLHPNADKRALADLPDIDCAARLHLCQARCCQLRFILSREDIVEGVVDWELSSPYEVRRRRDGYCAHNGMECRTCQVYEARPASCRLYDCRADPRIWLDFERRIPASRSGAALGRDGGYRADHGHDEDA